MSTKNASPVLARAEQAEARLEMLSRYVAERMDLLSAKRDLHELRLSRGKSCGCSPKGCSVCGYTHNCLHHGERQVYADILCMIEGYTPGTFGRLD